MAPVSRNKRGRLAKAAGRLRRGAKVPRMRFTCKIAVTSSRPATHHCCKVPLVAVAEDTHQASILGCRIKRMVALAATEAHCTESKPDGASTVEHVWKLCRSLQVSRAARPHLWSGTVSVAHERDCANCVLRNPYLSSPPSSGEGVLG